MRSFFLVKKIDHGAVVVCLSLHPNGTIHNGIQHYDNDINGRHGKVETFTIRQLTIEKKRFLWLGQRWRDHIDAIFGRKIDARKKTRAPFDN
jgi:hypothetical protein